MYILTTEARLCPYSDRSYVAATAEATQVYNYYCSDCPIWSMTERSKFLFRTLLFSVVGRYLAPLCSAYGLLVLLCSAYGLLISYILVNLSKFTLQCFVYLSVSHP